MDQVCEICGGSQWRVVHEGNVRDGAYGALRFDGLVARCLGCGADRLAEHCCPPPEFYEGEDYRRHLAQSLNTDSFLSAHDELQIFTQETLRPLSLRGRAIADIGCAGGSFLDHVSGLAKRIVAVEPCTVYHDGLKARGFEVYSYAADAAAKTNGIDLAVSLQVIEHVRDPRAFLAEIRPILKPDGLLVISTPNRNDILMNLLPDAYPEFFYRVAHRWYFDAASLAKCAELAGFEVTEQRFMHRYGLSNLLLWLRDRSPQGATRLPGINGLGDGLWRSFLESSGQSDCLYMVLRPATQHSQEKLLPL